MVKGMCVDTVGIRFTFKDLDEAYAKAKELLGSGVPVSMEWVDLPGECDAQRAKRLASELEMAQRGNGKLEEEIDALNEAKGQALKKLRDARKQLRERGEGK